MKVLENTPTIDKDRNIEIIKYFYGFGCSPWPTLEETAEKFSVGTRERIRQIIKSQFRDAVTLSDIPAMEHFREIVDGNRYWLQSDIFLEAKIVEAKLVEDVFSVRGLFNMMDDLGSHIAYDVYTPDMQTVTRSSLDKLEGHCHFIIRKSDVREMRFNKAKKLPGRCGIARLDYLENEGGYNTYRTLIENLIRFSEAAWTKDTKDGLWYLFEDGDNTLINYSEKVFSVLDTSDAMRLAETYRNALDGRSHKYDYPPVRELIADYLRSSRHFEDIEDTLSFIGQTTHLNDIERDAVEYLKSNGRATYTDLRTHLISNGYTKYAADKTVFRSPFIYTDRSRLGRKQHEYRLVGVPKDAPEDVVEVEDRYKRHLRRLQRIGDTDETVEQKIRKSKTYFKGGCSTVRNGKIVQSAVSDTPFKHW